ncbi:SsgA family sporulation/cell division regulator [Stackebrandtia albiflava]|uniref:SsgA family sporulation/cell division regulator n=1 Tax=Stackebrandtia albiflava TaxID=406432 RepID=UPI0011BE6BE5
MATTRPATVEVETTMRFVAPDFTTINVRASMRYDQGDPYAVHVVFHPSNIDAEQVSWSFARELLATGLVEPAGIGDVRVWPWSTPRGDAIALALSSPDGNALFEISRSLVSRFLRRSYALVPKGKEPETLNVDSAVARLLAER